MRGKQESFVLSSEARNDKIEAYIVGFLVGFVVGLLFTIGLSYIL